MTDWIHCNGCYRQPGSGKQFSLTNCGHIFCQDCLRSGQDERCKVCNEVFKSTPLNAEMNHDVAVYFNDPNDLLQKQVKQLTQTLQVVEFQRNHRRKMTAYIQEKLMCLMNKLSETVITVEKMQMTILERERELESIRKENIYLKQLLKSNSDRKSPNFLTRAHGDLESKDYGNCISFLPAHHSSNGQASVLDKSNKGSAESKESFTLNLASKLPSSGSSTQNVPLFNFRTPTTVTHISPGLARLSVRTPPSNGRLGEIPHYPASRNQVLYTPAMPTVRESPSPMESSESYNDRSSSQHSSRSAPATDRLLARFQANYPNVKP